MIQSHEQELEFEILKHIHSSRDKVRQRDLAHVVGCSLGMANSIIQRLITKGLLVISKVNNRNLSYALTPQGVREISRRSFKYFKQTIKNVVDYKDAIEARLLSFLGAGIENTHWNMLVLGQSELEFILEHLARKYSMECRVLRDQGDYSGLIDQPGLVVVFAEDMEENHCPQVFSCTLMLRDVIGCVA